MLTHELAEALRKLSMVLKRGPNIDVDEASLSTVFSRPPNRAIVRDRNADDLPLALSALVSLARIDKGEWIALISDLGFKVEVRPRDASRDILGKVLRLLESEPEARAKLQREVKNREGSASPELAKALAALLK